MDIDLVQEQEIIDPLTGLHIMDYTMNIDGYVHDWNHWSAWRELESNARDTGASYIIIKDGKDLVFQDEGSGLKAEHLMFGVSQSRDNNNAIGQFGEGLKLAMMIYTKLGFEVEIFSPYLYAKNSYKMLKGYKSFRILYEEYEYNKKYQGTKFVVHNYDGDMLNDNFIKQDDDRVLVELKQATVGNLKPAVLSENKLFVKGAFCQELPDFKFGYEIPTCKMNRDRNVAEPQSLLSGIGNLWASIDDPEGWKMILPAMIEDGSREKEMQLGWLDDNAKTAMEIAWVELYGKKAVVGGNDIAMDNEATHRGAKPINCGGLGYYVKNALRQSFGSSQSYVQEKMAKETHPVALSDLTTTQRNNYNLVKKLAKKLNYHGIIKIEDLSQRDFLGETRSPSLIVLDPKSLNHTEMAMSIMVHELGHAESGMASDLTDAHVNACTNIASRLAMVVLKVK